MGFLLGESLFHCGLSSNWWTHLSILILCLGTSGSDICTFFRSYVDNKNYEKYCDARKPFSKRWDWHSRSVPLLSLYLPVWMKGALALQLVIDILCPLNANLDKPHGPRHTCAWHWTQPRAKLLTLGAFPWYFSKLLSDPRIMSANSGAIRKDRPSLLVV